MIRQESAIGTSGIDPAGKITHNVRLLKSTVNQQGLTESYSLDELADEIVNGDPEIDIEAYNPLCGDQYHVFPILKDGILTEIYFHGYHRTGRSLLPRAGESEN